MDNVLLEAEDIPIEVIDDETLEMLIHREDIFYEMLDIYRKSKSNLREGDLKGISIYIGNVTSKNIRNKIVGSNPKGLRENTWLLYILYQNCSHRSVNIKILNMVCELSNIHRRSFIKGIIEGECGMMKPKLTKELYDLVDSSIYYSGASSISMFVDSIMITPKAIEKFCELWNNPKSYEDIKIKRKLYKEVVFNNYKDEYLLMMTSNAIVDFAYYSIVSTMYGPSDYNRIEVDKDISKCILGINKGNSILRTKESISRTNRIKFTESVKDKGLHYTEDSSRELSRSEYKDEILTRSGFIRLINKEIVKLYLDNYIRLRESLKVNDAIVSDEFYRYAKNSIVHMCKARNIKVYNKDIQVEGDLSMSQMNKFVVKNLYM